MLFKTYPKLEQIKSIFLPYLSDQGPAKREYTTAGRAWSTPFQDCSAETYFCTRICSVVWF